MRFSLYSGYLLGKQLSKGHGENKFTPKMMVFQIVLQMISMILMMILMIMIMMILLVVLIKMIMIMTIMMITLMIIMMVINNNIDKNGDNGINDDDHSMLIFQVIFFGESLMKNLTFCYLLIYICMGPDLPCLLLFLFR